MFGRKKKKQAKKQKRGEDFARILELVHLQDYGDHLFNYLVINEDYFLPREEIEEYYLPGFNLRKYIVVPEEDCQLSDGAEYVLLGGEVIAEVREEDQAQLLTWKKEDRIQKMDLFLGGGAYRQLLENRARHFSWEDSPEEEASTSELQETYDKDLNPMRIREREIPYYAHLYLQIRGDSKI